MVEGDVVTDRLAVDAAGLDKAAVGSAEIAQGLATDSGGNAGGSQPSHAGVAALDRALAALRVGQSRRDAGQGSDLRTAATVYTHSDEAAAENVTRTI